MHSMTHKVGKKCYCCIHHDPYTRYTSGSPVWLVWLYVGSHGFPQAWLLGLLIWRARALKISRSTLSNHKIMGLPHSQEPGSSALLPALSKSILSSKQNPNLGYLCPYPYCGHYPASLSLPTKMYHFYQNKILLILPLEQRISGLKAMVGNLKTKV